MPGKPASVEKQKEVIDELEGYIEEKDTVVLFFDPCHLQHNVVNARMWQRKGREGTINIKTNPGRKRINILGALNIKDISVISMLTEEKCNAIRVVEFLTKVREIFPEKKIIVIADNAKYNQANYTRTFAEWYGIELFFLPPYSPNLNLIERLWKFTKKKLVHNKYYEKFSQFTQEVEKYFRDLDQYKTELKTILTKKFQIIHAD